MRRSVMCFGMSAGALGLALALGCSHSGNSKGVTETSQPPLAWRSGRPVWSDPYASRFRKVQEGPDLPVGEETILSPYHTMPQPHPLAQASLPIQEEGIVRALRTEEKPERAEEKPEQALVERKPVREHRLLDEEPPQQYKDRRSYTDLTANPAFSHDKQYRWLIGVVEMNRKTRNWEIRYASVDEEDTYGGRLRLVHGDPPPPLQEGQLVRVEGWVAERTSPPAYRVQSVYLYSQP